MNDFFQVDLLVLFQQLVVIVFVLQIAYDLYEFIGLL